MEGTARLLAVLGLTVALGCVSAVEPRPKTHPAMMPPRLAKPLPDRGPVTDPARDFSAAAVLRAPLPVRTRPTPFVAMNLPDPYERRETVKLARTPAEDVVLSSWSPRMPKR